MGWETVLKLGRREKEITIQSRVLKTKRKACFKEETKVPSAIKRHASGVNKAAGRERLGRNVGFG